MCDNSSHLKKYRERNSPPYPANKCCGEKKVGNDGKMYTSSMIGSACRWKLSSPSKKSPAKAPARSPSNSAGGRQCKCYTLKGKGPRCSRNSVEDGKCTQHSNSATCYGKSH